MPFDCLCRRAAGYLSDADQRAVIRAFFGVKSAALRRAILRIVEAIAQASDD